MIYDEIIRETDRRILCVQPLPQGVEFTICQKQSDGQMMPVVNAESVIVPRATRRWIGHALATLSWNRGDMEKVINHLRDPRIEMHWAHAARTKVLEMPSHVMPQDGYQQLGSIWLLEDESFSACISDAAVYPEWWGEQIAAIMDQIVCANVKGEEQRKAALQLVLAGYYDALDKIEDDASPFASRYDWDRANVRCEIASIWCSGEGEILRVLKNDHLRKPDQWGAACAALTHEVVETLWVEREEQKQVVIEALTPPFGARLSKSRLGYERAVATVQ